MLSKIYLVKYYGFEWELGCDSSDGILYERDLFNNQFITRDGSTNINHIMSISILDTLDVKSAMSTPKYYKPCGHSVQLTCNCLDNGEAKNNIDKKCTCDIVLLMHEGCSCGSVKKYKPEDLK